MQSSDKIRRKGWRIVILVGDKTILRPLSWEDVPAFLQWCRDPELQDLSNGTYPTSLAECGPWYSSLRANRQHKHFAIIARDGRFIGDIELDSISWRRGEAELRICIGDPAYRNRGRGTDAVATLVSYAFFRLHLRLVYLRVYRDNRRAIRCYEKVGFRTVGWLRRAGKLGEREIYLMALTPEDLRAPVRALAG